MKISQKGFSLTEATISLAVAGVFMASVMAAWNFSAKAWHIENYRGEIRYGLEKALERIKEDVRLSDGGKILYNPSAGTPYTAMSIPSATRDSNGFFTYGASITWDKTIIYHLYVSGGKTQFRQTLINSYDTDTATRQSQLDSVVASGTAVGAATQVLFTADTATLQISPTNPTFDGYASSEQLSGNTRFGAARLTAGNHDIRFQVTGKNSASSGYQMGFDQISLSPSGGGQETEDLTVSASTGDSAATQDMSSYAARGPWKGNYHMEYQSDGVDDYIQFQTYYDQWVESNFTNFTYSDTEIVNANPVLQLASRERQSLAPSWQAGLQTDVNMTDNGTSVGSLVIRDIIAGTSVTKSGQMVRFKFHASSSQQLRIHSAYFGAQNSAQLYNFSGSTTQLYFGNADLPEGSTDGVGATGTTGSSSVTISGGNYVWSNWAEVNVTAGTNYLISFEVSDGVGLGNESYWSAASGTHSYADTAGGGNVTSAWAGTNPAFASMQTAIHTVSDMAVWTNTGSAISQIYDTKIASPAFSQLTWSTNGSGTYSIKVRTSSNSTMSGATAWSAVSSHSASPAALSIPSARYVQVQAALAAASPYTTYPQLDTLKITWPGSAALVELSGYYTKRPNYGIFKVLVDGNPLINAMSAALTVSNVFQGNTYSQSLMVELKPRNTGK